LPAKAIPEMTYTVSGGTLNSTHSLILSVCLHVFICVFVLCWLATLQAISDPYCQAESAAASVHGRTVWTDCLSAARLLPAADCRSAATCSHEPGHLLACLCQSVSLCSATSKFPNLSHLWCLYRSWVSVRVVVCFNVGLCVSLCPMLSGHSLSRRFYLRCLCFSMCLLVSVCFYASLCVCLSVCMSLCACPSVIIQRYLEVSEFESVFSMTLDDFYRLAEWKRNDVKARAGLF